MDWGNASAPSWWTPWPGVGQGAGHGDKDKIKCVACQPQEVEAGRCRFPAGSRGYQLAQQGIWPVPCHLASGETGLLDWAD